MYLIDRGELLMQMMHKFHYELPDGCNNSLYGDVIKVIEDAPLIEAEPVRHGEWVLGDVKPGYFTPGGNRPWICSECGQVVSWMLGKPNEKYCPNCGAKMDNGE